MSFLNARLGTLFNLTNEFHGILSLLITLNDFYVGGYLCMSAHEFFLIKRTETQDEEFLKHFIEIEKITRI